MDRRRFLATAGGCLFVAVAGCLDRSDPESDGTTATAGWPTPTGPTPEVTHGLELINDHREPLGCTVELRPANDADVDSAPLFAQQVSLQPTETLDLAPYRNGEPAILSIESDAEPLFEERIEPQEGLTVHIGPDAVRTDWVVA